MDDFTLRVTPETLEQKAGDFSSAVTQIQTRFQQIEDTASRTRGYWIGEAGDKDREGYASYQKDIQYVLNRLKEHPVDLLKMAGLYRDTEREVTDVSVSLPTSGLP